MAGKERIYLSGPISGRDERDWRRAFGRAEEFYSAAGFEVVSPARIADEVRAEFLDAGRGEPDYEDYMARDIGELGGCDAIAFLPGWLYSRGAMREMSEAIDGGLRLCFFKEPGK